jgi:hypothetical protein
MGTHSAQHARPDMSSTTSYSPHGALPGSLAQLLFANPRRPRRRARDDGGAAAVWRYKRVPTDLVLFFGRLAGEAWSWRELVMGVLRDSVVVVVWLCGLGLRRITIMKTRWPHPPPHRSGAGSMLRAHTADDLIPREPDECGLRVLIFDVTGSALALSRLGRRSRGRSPRGRGRGR